eukprot:COSAG04_NODE_5174_length_1713_cov_3.106568_3_plen_211_part_00
MPCGSVIAILHIEAAGFQSQTRARAGSNERHSNGCQMSGCGLRVSAHLAGSSPPSPAPSFSFSPPVSLSLGAAAGALGERRRPPLPPMGLGDGALSADFLRPTPQQFVSEECSTRLSQKQFERTISVGFPAINRGSRWTWDGTSAFQRQVRTQRSVSREANTGQRKRIPGVAPEGREGRVDDHLAQVVRRARPRVELPLVLLLLWRRAVV